ncbi:hypothetical protein Ddc_19921 [Ditylenchus destructor]|nr:hypothetical protein Ddc_19921 [Ditylenchus destructor]
MAQTSFYCQECQMDFQEVSDIKRHISAEHIDYFPYKCLTCKKIGVRHETVSVELMREHTSTVHVGTEPNVRFSTTEEDELDIAIEKCRRNDSKDAVRKVVITIGDTLADTGNGAIENVVTSTEFEREGDSLDVHESTNNDSIGPTNEGLIQGIQPENATTEPNFNANLQGLIHSIKIENIKAEIGSSNVNSQENAETIDSQIPPVSSTEPTAVVETQENVTNPTTNSENTSALNAKSESPVNVSAALSSYVPIDVDANEAQHNSVAITTGRTPRISRRNPKPSPERRYPKRSVRRPAMEAINIDEDEEDEYTPVPKRTSNKPSMSRKKQSRNELDNDFHSYKSSLSPVASPKSVRRRILRRKTWQTSVIGREVQGYSIGNSKQSSHPTSKSTREPLKLLTVHESLKKKQFAGPSTVARSLPSHHSSEVNCSTAHNSNEDTNGNGQSEKPATLTQDAFDVPSKPAPKKKITNIWINIGTEYAQFETLGENMSARRPLCEHLPILHKSEADFSGCEAFIYNFLHDGKRVRVIPSREKLKNFLEQVRSISHLWSNGRVVTYLDEYYNFYNNKLHISDFCEELFHRNRSILASRELEIELDNDCSLPIVANLAHLCKHLILKLPRSPNKRLYNTFLDIIYDPKLPKELEITLMLEFGNSAEEFTSELIERFENSTAAAYFKFTVIFPFDLGSSRLANPLQLDNKYSKLEVTQRGKTGGLRKAVIEQRPIKESSSVSSSSDSESGEESESITSEQSKSVSPKPQPLSDEPSTSSAQVSAAKDIKKAKAIRDNSSAKKGFMRLSDRGGVPPSRKIALLNAALARVKAANNVNKPKNGSDADTGDNPASAESRDVDTK